MAVHSKFYYFDAGVYKALRPCGPLDYPKARCFFLYRGERKEYWPDIEILPVRHLLTKLREILANAELARI